MKLDMLVEQMISLRLLCPTRPIRETGQVPVGIYTEHRFIEHGHRSLDSQDGPGADVPAAPESRR